MTEKNDVHLSKNLSWLLRHGAVKEGLSIKPDGYIDVLELLKHKTLNGKYSVEDVKRVVATNDKKRFNLRSDEGVLEICANQGHSLSIVSKPDLIPLNGSENINIIHGTYYKHWNNIKQEGLNRMKRNHIHFSLGLPTDRNIISGMRNDVDIFIYINFKLSITDNLKFYRSANDVILSPGDENGVILPKYFLKVVDKKGKNLI